MKRTTFRALVVGGSFSRWRAYRFGLLMSLLPLLLSNGTALAEDALDRQININIVANTSLEEALIDWGFATGISVMINAATVDGRLAPAVHGHLIARDALTALLKNSGLSYSESGGRIRVVPVSTLVHSTLSKEHDVTSRPIGLDFTAR